MRVDALGFYCFFYCTSRIRLHFILASHSLLQSLFYTHLIQPL
jgi:hypothetical protein